MLLRQQEIRLEKQRVRRRWSRQFIVSVEPEANVYKTFQEYRLIDICTVFGPAVNVKGK
jgi:hypothetical protein